MTKTTAATALLLDDTDNVFCVLRSHQAGDCPILLNTVGRPCSSPVLLDDVPLGHKVARAYIENNTAIIKYGAVIGYATQAIPAGAHVHLHNLVGPLSSKLSP